MVGQPLADDLDAGRGHAAAEPEELLVVKADVGRGFQGRFGVRQHLEDEQSEADRRALDGGERLLTASCRNGEAEHRPDGAVVVDGGEGRVERHLMCESGGLRY